MPGKKAARKVAQPRKSEARVTRAIHLLELLSSVEGAVITEQEALCALACTPAELDECMDLISTLADRATGARARIFRDHGDIVLEGGDANLVAVRLSAGEGSVLAALLRELDLDEAARGRLGATLLPAGEPVAPAPIAPGPVLGAHFPALSRAIDEGRACRMLYRSQREEEASERLIAPMRIEVADGSGYLLAIDRDKGRARRYRLDRITHLEVLDPVLREAIDDGAEQDLAASLRHADETVQLELDAGEDVPAWAGIERAERQDAGPWLITLKVSARPWLFDQVLSFAGRMRIVAPAEMRRAFCSYARKLVLPR